MADASAPSTNPLRGLSNPLANAGSSAKIASGRARAALGKAGKAAINAGLSAVGSPALAKAANAAWALSKNKYARTAYLMATLAVILIPITIAFLFYYTLFNMITLAKEDPAEFVELYGVELAEFVIDIGINAGGVDCAWEVAEQGADEIRELVTGDGESDDSVLETCLKQINTKYVFERATDDIPKFIEARRD